MSGQSSAAVPVQTLRFGVMCKGTTLEAWQAQCVRDLMAVAGVEPALLIVDIDGPEASARKPLLQRLTGKLLLWNLYKRMCLAGKLKSQAPVDMSALLGGLAQIECKVEVRGKISQYFSPHDVEAIRAHQLDFILRFGFNIIKGDVLNAARYGVWSYHHDDLNMYRGKPASFWPFYADDPVTGVTLQRLTEGIDNGVVLGQSHFATMLKSYPRSRDHVFMGSTGMPAKVCKDLLAGHGEYVCAEPSKTTAPMAFSPTNGQMLVFLARTARNRVRDAAHWLFGHRQWCVGLIDAPIVSFLDPRFRPRVRWMPGIPRERFIADPFGVRRGNTTTLLAEELDQSEHVGRIIAVEWADGGEPSVTRGVLELPVHASYPYLIEVEGSNGVEMYCVPETGAADEVALYRAVLFPTRWERVCTLIQGVKALDASLIQFEGRWWMFYGVKGASGAVELHAAWADALVGPWTPHATNPLKIDVRSTRPGGTPFVHEGKLYRPAQDGSRGYGGAVAINHVSRLSPTEFSEDVVRVVRPDEGGMYPAGIHTISTVGDQTVIDGQRSLFVPALFKAEIKKIAQRIFGAWR